MLCRQRNPLPGVWDLDGKYQRNLIFESQCKLGNKMNVNIICTSDSVYL